MECDNRALKSRCTGCVVSCASNGGRYNLGTLFRRTFRKRFISSAPSQPFVPNFCLFHSPLRVRLRFVRVRVLLRVVFFSCARSPRVRARAPRMSKFVIAKRLAWVPEAAKIKDVDGDMLGEYVYQVCMSTHWYGLFYGEYTVISLGLPLPPPLPPEPII